ncbi:LOW QUALITY PROTEIN: E3 ubiquitin-protein transferase RMND5B [Rhynchonycteris naso]
MQVRLLAETTMEQCASVEREVDKVLRKFLTYGQCCEQSLKELLHHVSQLWVELARTGGCPPPESYANDKCAGPSVCLLGSGTGHSSPCSLFCSFASGCVALPVLMNIKAVIEQRQCMGVCSHKDELPIEIELGMKCWYHSVFSCPILRQQTLANPPIKLTCGHVISRDALNKLINGGKLKCPYCPMEWNAADGKHIVF